MPRTLARRSPTRLPRLRSEICRAGTGFSRRSVQIEIERMTAATASDTRASSGRLSYSASFSRKVGDMGQAPLLVPALFYARARLDNDLIGSGITIYF